MSTVSVDDFELETECFYEGEYRRGFPKGELDCSKKNKNEFWKKIKRATPNINQ